METYKELKAFYRNQILVDNKPTYQLMIMIMFESFVWYQ